MKKKILIGSVMLLFSIGSFAANPVRKCSLSHEVDNLSTVTNNRTSGLSVKEEVYILRPKVSDGFGLFINNRRVMSGATHTINLDDIISMERPSCPQTRWYINDQFIGTGNFVSFIPRDYLYSADHNEFLISWE